MRGFLLLAKGALGLGRPTAAIPFLFAVLLGGVMAPAVAQAQSESPAPAAQSMLAPPSSGSSSMLAAPKDTSEKNHALALRARWVTVPGWTLSPYLAANTELNDGWGLGLEYLYRHPGFDVVVSVDYTSLAARDGNFLGKSNNPATETHFIHFDKLASLSADVSLIGHWNLTNWMEIRFGAGLGIGYVFGELYQITNNSGCTAENANDTSKCFPTRIGQIPQPPTADTIAKLEGARCSPDFTDGGRDTPASPCYRRTDTYPFNVRVVPVLNVLLGLRFKLYQHVYLHLDGGFRLAGFYAGGGPEFRF